MPDDTDTVFLGVSRSTPVGPLTICQRIFKDLDGGWILGNYDDDDVPLALPRGDTSIGAMRVGAIGRTASAHYLGADALISEIVTEWAQILTPLQLEILCLVKGFGSPQTSLSQIPVLLELAESAVFDAYAEAVYELGRHAKYRSMPLPSIPRIAGSVKRNPPWLERYLVSALPRQPMWRFAAFVEMHTASNPSISMAELQTEAVRSAWLAEADLFQWISEQEDPISIATLIKDLRVALLRA